MSNTPSKSRLYELYWGNDLSIGEIADRYETQKKIVHGWFQAYGVPYGDTNNRSAYVFRQLSDTRLYELCWSEQRSSTEIAERYGISKALVNREYDRRGIPTPYGGHHNAWVFRMLSRDCLYELYWGEGLTQREIAERFNVSPHFVHKLYDEREIPQEDARPPDFSGDSIPQAYRWPDDRDNGVNPQDQPLPENPDGSKYIVTDDPLFNKSELYRLYWGLGLSVEHIASREDVSDDAVRRHLQNHGIPIRQWSNHLRWEPHHGVPPKYEWPPEREWTETEAQAASDYEGARWRTPAAE